MNAVQQTLKKHWLWILVNVGALYPLLLLVWNFWTNNLGVNPIDSITDSTGKTALILLVLSLAVTPISILSGYKPVMKVRKSLGLHAFLYTSLHLLTFIGLDYGFNLDLIFGDALLSKRYVIVGFLAFLIMVPLAITSTKGWMRRLGRNWKQLHKLVYLAGGLAVLHFLWLVKLDLTEPLIYAGILAVLLLMRVPFIRKQIGGWRRRLTAGKKEWRRHDCIEGRSGIDFRF